MDITFDICLKHCCFVFVMQFFTSYIELYKIFFCKDAKYNTKLKAPHSSMFLYQKYFRSFTLKPEDKVFPNKSTMKKGVSFHPSELLTIYIDIFAPKMQHQPGQDLLPVFLMRKTYTSTIVFNNNGQTE